MREDYNVFSGIALERWFRQQMMESCRYMRIGGWWKSGGQNAKGNNDDFEIDIVAETIDGAGLSCKGLLWVRRSNPVH